MSHRKGSNANPPTISHRLDCHQLISQTLLNRQLHKYASCLDWSISPHANRHQHKEFTTLAVTEQAAACSSHHTRSTAVQQVCCTGLMTIKRVINSSILNLGAYPWAKGHQKGRWPGSFWNIPSCKISSLYVNPCPKYPLPKILRTNRQNEWKTVTDICPTCLSACGHNKCRRSAWTAFSKPIVFTHLKHTPHSANISACFVIVS